MPTPTDQDDDGGDPSLLPPSLDDIIEDDAALSSVSGSGDALVDDAAMQSKSGSGDIHDDDAFGGSGDAAPLGVAREEQRNDHEEAVVTCTTTAGPVVLRLHRSWAPNGYDRAASLFERGYYDRSHFFRVVPHFLVQFGISYTKDAALTKFASTTIQDDPKPEEPRLFREGMLSFAGGGPNSRTCQLFIAYDRAGSLGSSPWEIPFGEVVEGIGTIRNLYSGYGDMPPWGKGPQQGPIHNRGSSYIEEEFPLLDRFETCTVKRLSLNGGSIVQDESAMTGAGEDASHGSTGGHGEVKAGVAKENSRLRATPNAKEEMADGPFPLLWKVAVLGSVLGMLYQILVRRKRSKQAGKRN